MTDRQDLEEAYALKTWEHAARLSLLVSGLAVLAATSWALTRAPAPNLLSGASGIAGMMFFGLLTGLFSMASVKAYFDAARTMTVHLNPPFLLLRGPFVIAVTLIAFGATVGMPVSVVWILAEGGFSQILELDPKAATK